MVGYTNTDRPQNTEIMKRTKVFKVNVRTHNYRNNWLQLLEVMEGYLIPKEACEYQPQGS
jgi:hypothetical protein